ncbi:MAG: tetratricopeptide repeat protein [Bacteroidales bacterium]|nr:tetratricopeptide repeat protein [Bacteroidales bacterium]
MRRTFSLIISILFSVLQVTNAQNTQTDILLNKADSLRVEKPDSAVSIALSVLKGVSSDSIALQVKGHYILGNCYYSLNNFDEALDQYKQSLMLSRLAELYSWSAQNLNRIGNVYQLKSKLFEALESYKQALEINRGIDDKVQIARTLVNIATVYSLTGFNTKAIEQMLEALDTYEQENKQEGIAWTSLSIARLFGRVELYEKALQYAETALQSYRRLNNQNGIILSLTELGNIYYHNGLYEKSLSVTQQVLNANIQNHNYHGQAANYLLTGIIFFEQNKIDKANEYLNTSLQLKEKLNDSLDLAKLYRYLGDVTVKKGNIEKGITLLNKALKIALKQKVLSDQRDIYQSLSQAYRISRNYEYALNAYERFSTVKDSINAGHIARLEMQYDFDKREHEAELVAKQREAVQQAKLERQRTITFSISIALILALALVILIFYFYREKKRTNYKLVEQNREILRQKNEIEDQKHEIESQRDLAEKQRDQIAEQQKQITDSITYASRIQAAVLPPLQNLQPYFKDFFVYYQPKNIVSGDFFWATKLPDGRLAVAAADCTGHGVPGAFMSMLGITLLRELATTSVESSGEMLFKLRRLVTSSLNQHGEESESHDGMDMALLVINLKENVVEFSGAYMPLVVVRNKNSEPVPNSVNNQENDVHVVYEVKGDKMPVGFHLLGEKPFTTHQFKLLPDDRIYLLSDGYTDQFGGDKNLKLMMVNFKKILLDIQPLNMSEQKAILEQRFIEYKGNQRQVDDIVVMGFEL